MTFEPGQMVGRYRIDEKVGTGVYMTEYLATDPQDPETTLVLKVLGQRHLGEHGSGSRFTEAARAMQAMRSTDVAEIVHVGETEAGQPFVVRPLSDRGTLHDRLRLGRPANDDDLRRIIAFLGRTLTALHEAGVTHGNLRSTNVLIASGTPQPGVTFGILWEDDKLMLGEPVPPELVLATGRAAGQTSDISAANQLVAEAALGRCRHGDESWSDLLVAISGSGRFELAAALGKAASLEASEADQRDIARWAEVVGGPFAPVPGKKRSSRVPTRGAAQGNRAALGARTGKAVVYASVAAAVLIALGGVWIGQTRGEAPDAQAFVEAPTPAPTAVPTPMPTPAPRDDLGAANATQCLDQESGEAVADFGLASVSHDTIHVTWQPTDVEVAVAVNGTEVGQADPGASDFTIERLGPDTLYVISAYVISAGAAQGPGSVVCAQTFPAPTPVPDPNAEPPFGSKIIVVD